jgi:hypothetical protein
MSGKGGEVANVAQKKSLGTMGGRVVGFASD